MRKRTKLRLKRNFSLLGVALLGSFLSSFVWSLAGRVIWPEQRYVTQAEGGDGHMHFYVTGEIYGKAMPFVVDTGAVNVLISHRAAIEIGIDPDKLEYDETITTPSGGMDVALITVPVLIVGRIKLRDVEVAVAQPDIRRPNLLGMSFLMRLKRFESHDGQLTLVQ
jgi:clan AA aspartic protease (TIGR02281 family)